MSSKTKGSNAERELVHLFQASGWSCVRIAGSGSSQYPDPDILAGNAIRRLAIECKVTKENKKYIKKEDIEQLKTFADTFGTEAWIAVRFSHMPWYFLLTEDLEQTGESFAVSKRHAQRRGLLFEELTQINGFQKKDNI